MNYINSEYYDLINSTHKHQKNNISTNNYLSLLLIQAANDKL